MITHEVVLLCGQKGGVGKSTLATNLATIAQCAGAEVMVVDGDKQQSTRRFLDLRRELHPGLPTPLCVQAEGKGSGRLVDSLADKYSLVVVDLGGGDTEILRSVLNADAINRVWLPTQPSGPDVQTLPFMVELVDEYSRNSRPLEAHAILNRAETNVRVNTTEGSLDYMRRIEGLHIANAIIRERVAFKKAMVSGLNVPEYLALEMHETTEAYRRKQPKAADEILALFAEIIGMHADISLDRFGQYLSAIVDRGLPS